MKILIINGPNLNLLGKREPEIYGKDSFEDFLIEAKKIFPEVKLEYFQSNVEGELIDELQKNGFKSDHPELKGIVFNPGGYSHTSVALADAVSAIEIPVVEVHISNVHSREEFRQKLITARSAKGVISGFGMKSYLMAINFIIDMDN